ncbi:aminotransferase class V-fold PLP-dependent enzyme [Pseudohongiella spirulinae]|uniref:Aminotransferase n=1 Tax=Pseudohongiella spirulinae TaxID=1249552 RepID=A0A0S2KCR6_9GAMM|nr:aminotransferase class V-fold PLP-dependent enzyme [Pseudohongiella spirulinae]ALO45973.1 aminotransferase [Pseudohongiella spirulinae]
MSQLIEKIRHAVIGQRRAVETPFGIKPLIYADYTASGRSLEFVEDVIHKQVMPVYANTHTETTYTGAQTTAWRESARKMIRSAVNGTDEDKVIFVGSGATAAINRFIDVLNLRGQQKVGKTGGRKVVLVGPYEHHSNELPWRESAAEVLVIPLDSQGRLSLQALQQTLQSVQEAEIIIGSFSAASNVTGIKTDVDAVTRLLKSFGALVCWDYAAAGPYTAIDMTDKDAVFLSPHKFVGGPGTPGVLVAKSKWFRNAVPVVPGGGTVSFVTPEKHVYISDIERREEAGTPAIIESIRAGLVVSLQKQVGIDVIESRERDMARYVMQRLQSIPDVQVLGSADAERLPIFSLRFWHNGRELHYGFIVSLLNDLFGIQVRGGCSCAGPYAHHLLGLSVQQSEAIESAVSQGASIMRPGWVRLNFNYFIDDEEREFLISAIELVARYGWKLLPSYCYDTGSGVWRFAGQSNDKGDPVAEIDWLNMQPGSIASLGPESLAQTLSEAERHLAISPAADNRSAFSMSSVFPEHESLRWFVSPDEVVCNDL